MGRLLENGKKFMNYPMEKSYWQQGMSGKDRFKMRAIAVLLTFVTGWLYYQSIWGVLALSPLGYWFYCQQKRQFEEKQKSEFLMKFKEMIQDIAASLNTGYSVENALNETKNEMLLIYSKEDLICKELAYMVRQMQVQIPAEQVMEEFAERIGLEDVRNFATVFVTAKRTGGDLILIIRNTVNQMGSKIDVKREIDTILAAKRYEFQVMSMIPFLIIAYMQVSFPEFMGILYKNPLGIGVMTGCLGVYVAAYILGTKLIQIEV